MEGWILNSVCLTPLGRSTELHQPNRGSSSTELGLRSCGLTRLREAREELVEACKVQLAAQARVIEMAP